MGRLVQPVTRPEHEFDRRLLAEVVDSVPDAVIVVDRGGAIRYWNGGAERIFGHRGPDVLGKSLDLIIPERLRDRHWSGFEKAVATGTSRYGPDDVLSVPALAADGSTISVEFTVTFVREGGSVASVAAVLRDVTQRRRQEADLRHRVAELEALARAASPGAPDAGDAGGADPG